MLMNCFISLCSSFDGLSGKYAAIVWRKDHVLRPSCDASTGHSTLSDAFAWSTCEAQHDIFLRWFQVNIKLYSKLMEKKRLINVHMSGLNCRNKLQSSKQISTCITPSICNLGRSTTLGMHSYPIQAAHLHFNQRKL